MEDIPAQESASHSHELAHNAIVADVQLFQVDQFANSGRQGLQLIVASSHQHRQQRERQCLDAYEESGR